MKLLKRLPVLAPHSAPASATPRSHASCQSGPRRILSLLSGNGGLATRLATFTAAILLGLPQVQAVDYHVTTAQELQNALTLAAANGADDNIYLAPCTNYTGNFNFNSTENRSLVIQGEPGTTNTQISIDGAGTGRDMNLANTGTGNFTVRGITFLRNCGSTSIGALRIAGGTGSTLLVDSCRFLSPTNTSATGTGLETASGQNATVTNCVAVGKPSGRGGSGTGLLIAGITGSVTVGGCNCATNSFVGLDIPSAGSATMTGNAFTGNGYHGASVTTSGDIAFLNSSAIGNNGYGAALHGASLLVAGNLFRNNQSHGCFAGAASYAVSNNVFGNNVSLGADLSSSGPGGPITQNTFTGNGGGGLRCGGGNTSPILIAGNTFAGNLVQGGLECGGPSTITNNTFTGNSATWGYGAGLNCFRAATVTANTFVGNTTVNGPGGNIYMGFDTGSAVVSKNMVRQGSASQQGGGIYCVAPTVTITDNLVAKNSQTGSGYQGGGIYVNASSTLTMINNTVSDNTTTGNGGGLVLLC